jgi:hypothetical protein
VSDAILVDPEDPSGAIAAEPFGRPLNNTRSNQVIWAPVVTHIFVEGGDRYPFMHHNVLTVFSDTGFRVRQAQQLAKESIEIRTDPNWA